MSGEKTKKRFCAANDGSKIARIVISPKSVSQDETRSSVSMFGEQISFKSSSCGIRQLLCWTEIDYALDGQKYSRDEPLLYFLSSGYAGRSIVTVAQLNFTS